MNKILRLSAIALLASSTSLMAQSKSFEGLSAGIGLSVIGVEIAGSNAQASGDTSTGTVGKITEIASLDLSYGFAASSNFVIGVGASYTPGKAKAGSGSLTDGTAGGSDGSGSATVTIKDPYTVYVMPTYVLNKDSALFAKIGYTQADVTTTSAGRATVTSGPGNLEGWAYTIGSKNMLTNNTYLSVEATYSDYDTLSATMSNGTTVTGSPKTIQGTVSIGYKF